MHPFHFVANRKLWLLAMLVGGTLLLSVLVATAQGPKPGQPSHAASNLGTGFTYQGQLKSSGAPVNGMCDIAFRLYDAPSSGNVIGTAMTPTVAITGGLFTTPLDFGTGAFNGEARWLDMQVSCPAGGTFTALNPRQALTPAPMALALPGLWTQQNQTSPNLIGGFSGNLISPTLFGATIGGGGSSVFPNRAWGDWATVGGGANNNASGYIATVGGGDNNTASDDQSTVGGGTGNTASKQYATIGGGNGNTAGGTWSTVGGGESNGASNQHATVGGGAFNNVSGAYATVGGGNSNLAGGVEATVAGGRLNKASSDHATVGGGANNTASGNGAMVGGGYTNTASAASATVGGGANNTVTNTYATVGGGNANLASGVDATVSGGTHNKASSDHATVGGGGNNNASGYIATVGGGELNSASNSWATIGGGYSNTVTNAYATVGGGTSNLATGVDATVSGGTFNKAISDHAAVGGGGNNTASGYIATVGGGELNSASNSWATVGGGQHNNASGQFTTVPGGDLNVALGQNSFAAGHRAKANHQGSFVWADSTDTDFVSNAPNQYLVRASGGIILYSNSTATSGVTVPPGSGSWSSVSDRSAKANFNEVDVRAIVAQLATLPMQTWNYNTQDAAIRHIGPMAQDFHAAFGVGENDTTISTVDAQGVAFAAIQGLYQAVQEKDAQIAVQHAQIVELQKQNATVEARLTALEERANTANPAANAQPVLLALGTLVVLGVAYRQHRANRGRLRARADHDQE